jgi:hypothetical protein
MRLAFIAAVSDWLRDRFGSGQGTSCRSIGCRMILLVVFVILVCGTCAFTGGLQLSF